MTKYLLTYQRITRDLLLSFLLLILSFIVLDLYIETNFDLLVPKALKVKGVGKNTLALNSLFPQNKEQVKLNSIDFSKELYVLTCPQRPDSSLEKRLFIAHKKGWLQEEVFLEEWFFLRENSKGYSLSKEKTPLKFRIVEKKGQLVVEQQLEFDEIDQEKFFVGVAKGFSPEIKPLQEKKIVDPFASLFNSIYFGRDLLRKGEFYQIEVDGKPFFVQKNTIFVFNDNHWQKLTDQKTKGLPIFRVEEAEDLRIFLEGWDASGKYYSRNLLTPKANDPTKKAMNWISQVKKRTKSKVSLNLLGKRMILKKGDWLVEKNKKWVALRTELQKENFLNLKAESEIFVFEDIEENKGDKKFIGLLYNVYRNKATRMEILFGNNTTMPVQKTPELQKKTRYTPLSRRGSK